MKKYRRLLLLVITFVSALGFIVYRNEYKRLRSVFEVGELFGKENFGDDCLVLNKSVEDKAKYNQLFSRPSHQWIRINDLYLYSAFWRNGNDKSKSVALGVSSVESYFQDYNCHVWYHLGGSLFSVTGTLSSNSKKINNSLLIINELFCEIDNGSLKGTPYMFVLVDANKKYFVPIYFKVNVEKFNKAAVCVYPDNTGLERINIIEFLSYHKSVNFSDIIVYDNGIQHGVISVLENVFLNIDFLRSFSILPWQFPFDNVEAEEEFIKHDCFYRVFNQVDLVTFLHWNEYIIPRQGKNILALFNHLGSSRSIQFSFEHQRCCTEQKNDIRAKLSWPVMLKKTLCIKQPSYRTAILNPNSFYDQYYENVSSSLAIVNSYDSCEMMKETKIFPDKTALKFIVDLMNNELLKISRSGIFFESK